MDPAGLLRSKRSARSRRCGRAQRSCARASDRATQRHYLPRLYARLPSRPSLYGRSAGRACIAAARDSAPADTARLARNCHDDDVHLPARNSVRVACDRALPRSIVGVPALSACAAIAINFSAPLFSALLSVVWLKELAGAARWTALLTGFLGVLIVAHPGADSLTLGALFALANAVMYGSVTVAVRGMTATESTTTLVMWQMVTVAVLHSLLLLFGFRSPAPADAAML